MSRTVKLQKVNGRSVISTNSLTHCNEKYHAPYLAVISPTGEMDWQEKEYIGYGKHRETYYVVENLQPGDLIQAAGGSGGNKYPFKGRVVALDLEAGVLEVEAIDDKEFSNLLAERKKAAPKETPPIVLNEEEEALLKALRGLAPERRLAVLQVLTSESK